MDGFNHPWNIFIMASVRRYCRQGAPHLEACTPSPRCGLPLHRNNLKRYPVRGIKVTQARSHLR